MIQGLKQAVSSIRWRVHWNQFAQSSEEFTFFKILKAEPDVELFVCDVLGYQRWIAKYLLSIKIKVERSMITFDGMSEALIVVITNNRYCYWHCCCR
jgi:hypothetical protein